MSCHLPSLPSAIRPTLTRQLALLLLVALNCFPAALAARHLLDQTLEGELS